jgi:serine/threonine-protein kinase HipA
MSEFFVYADTEDTAGIYVGRCYWTARRGRVSSMFSYDDSYIADKGGWNIDPALVFAGGAQPSDGELPGAFRDASPDRWGRTLIEHRFQRELQGGSRGEPQRRSAVPTGRPRSLNEVDYLLGVSDYARQGCLRLSRAKGGTFEHPSADVPKLMELPRLLRSAQHFMLKDDEASVAYLLEAGSASLGGARPKASVRDDDRLLVAKFPHRQDAWDVVAWEWVLLEMAGAAGIGVPPHELLPLEGKNVLLTERFDRCGARRLGYISAMTLLGRKDGERADYRDIALALRDVSAAAVRDLEELFRRIVFSVCVNNTDDHLRNHGLLCNGSGWRLSPAFDVNPNPQSTSVRETGIFGETRREAALPVSIENADLFGLSHARAAAVTKEVLAAMRSWSAYAAAAKIPRAEQSRFRWVFEET